MNSVDVADVVTRVRRWIGAPQVFEVTAVLATALLLVLESRIPWSIVYSRLGDGRIAIEYTDRPAWAAVGSFLLIAAPLVALRSTLLGVFMVVPRLVMGLAVGFAWPWTAYAALMCVAVCVSWRRPRIGWVVAAIAVAQPIAIIARRGRMMTPGGSVEFGLGVGAGPVWWLIVTSLLYVIATVAIMLVTVLLRREASRTFDLIELVRRRREVTRDAAVLGERSRLARDLHDVVAHHVSLIAVRAETAPYIYSDLSSDARVVLAEIAEESRQALDELRSVLGILRRPDGASERAPQPTAANIERLLLDVQPTTHVGSVSLQGLDTVEATAGYVAYRVAQEALTNARRHAPEAMVDLVAHGNGVGGIRVLVKNRASDVTLGVEHGQGLIGMAERVAAAGGTLDVGLRGTDFVIEARVPGMHGPQSSEQEAIT